MLLLFVVCVHGHQPTEGGASPEKPRWQPAGMALPDGFSWTPWIPGAVALKLGDHLVGLVVGGCVDGGCRVERNIGTTQMRSAFFSHPDIGVRFLEAWAQKWEAKIRPQYGSLSMSTHEPPSAPDIQPMQTSHRRKARRPRVF